MKNIKNLMFIFFCLGITLFNPHSFAAGTKKKFQEITFGEMDVEGAGRSPDGAYLVQRRGLRFLPLYEVKKDLDLKIRKSTSYLK